MSIPKTSGERVKLARNLLGLTRSAISENYNINYNTLQSWEIGRTQLTPQGAKKLNSALVQAGLMCTSEWLLTGIGSFPTLVLDPKNSNSSDLEKTPKIFYEIEVFKAIHPDSIVMQIEDDSMIPLYEPGDYVAGIKESDDEEIEKLIAKNCIVETRNDDILARKVVGGSKKPLFSLLCLNHNHIETPIFIPDMKLRYAAKIIWHRKNDDENGK